jgi:hypothetical protein
VADLTPLDVGPPVTLSPSLGEVLPVHARTAVEEAAQLQRVQQLKAELAATSWSWWPPSPPTDPPPWNGGPASPAPPPPRRPRAPGQ